MKRERVQRQLFPTESGNNNLFSAPLHQHAGRHVQHLFGVDEEEFQIVVGMANSPSESLPAWKKQSEAVPRHFQISTPSSTPTSYFRSPMNQIRVSGTPHGLQSVASTHLDVGKTPSAWGDQKVLQSTLDLTNLPNPSNFATQIADGLKPHCGKTDHFAKKCRAPTKVMSSVSSAHRSGERQRFSRRSSSGKEEGRYTRSCSKTSSSFRAARSGRIWDDGKSPKTVGIVSRFSDSRPIKHEHSPRYDGKSCQHGGHEGFANGAHGPHPSTYAGSSSHSKEGTPKKFRKYRSDVKGNLTTSPSKYSQG